MASQLWFRWWLGAVRQQAITWSNVDPDLYQDNELRPGQNSRQPSCRRHEKYTFHDDVIKWKHLPRYWPLVRGIHRSPVTFPHKDQWRGALMFSLICVWINGWVNNREAGDFRRYRAHYVVIVMLWGMYILIRSLLKSAFSHYSDKKSLCIVLLWCMHIVFYIYFICICTTSLM